MLIAKYSTQFKKDLKQLEKRGLDLSLLKTVIINLMEQKKLPKRNKDHLLVGNFKGYRECHILPDWLLIYTADDEYLYLSRTGSHSDIF
ncbi:MAG: type II toxin-antitoxin system YafQ family toxin [Bacillota bacterium]|jgi:mRNA interferase YafQ